MRDSWLNLVGSVLRPARPRLEACLREREAHLAARRLFAEGRAQALARCESRIENLRAEVFVAKDGVVTLLMTDLERQWRTLARRDPDAGLMDLWVRIAPASWVDRKRWRDSEPAAQVDSAIALAADVAGIEAAEAAIDALRVALGAWGIPVGPRIRWRSFVHDAEHSALLLAEPLRAAREELVARGVESVVLERAQRLEREVLEGALARFPERESLARDLAHAAYVDGVWYAASLSTFPSSTRGPSRPDPVRPLRDLWKTGYVLSAIDASGVTVELPPL